jgi:hypothetical protein
MTPDEVEVLCDADFAAMVRLMVREGEEMRRAADSRR